MNFLHPSHANNNRKSEKSLPKDHYDVTEICNICNKNDLEDQITVIQNALIRSRAILKRDKEKENYWKQSEINGNFYYFLGVPEKRSDSKMTCKEKGMRFVEPEGNVRSLCIMLKYANFMLPAKIS